MFQFIKSILTGNVETPEEKDRKEQQKNFDILKYDGIRAISQQQYAYAEKCLQAAIAINKEPEAMEYLAQLYRATGRQDEELELWQTLAAEQTDTARYLLLMADIRHARGEYAEVISLCQEAMGREPESISPYYYSARARHSKGDWLMAVADLTKALGMKPESADLLLMRATILYEMGQIAEARKDMELLLEGEDGDHEEVLLLDGQLLQAEGNVEQAKARFTKLIETNPFNRKAYLMLAEVFLGEPDGAAKAIDVCTEGIEENDNFAEAYYLRGRARYQMDKSSSDALEDVKQAMALDPQIEEKISGVFRKSARHC